MKECQALPQQYPSDHPKRVFVSIACISVTLTYYYFTEIYMYPYVSFIRTGTDLKYTRWNAVTARPLKLVRLAHKLVTKSDDVSNPIF